MRSKAFTTSLMLTLPVLGLVMFATPVAAASFSEDFEDDTVGQNPAGAFYTYAEDADYGVVVSEGGSQAFRFASGSSSTANGVSFTLNDVSTGSLAFSPFAFDTGETLQRQHFIRVRNSDGVEFARVNIAHNFNQPAATFVSYFSQGGCAIAAPIAALDTYYTFELVFNFATQEYQIRHNGAPTTDADCNTIPFSAPAVSWKSFRMTGVGSQNTRLTIDLWSLTDVEATPLEAECEQAHVDTPVAFDDFEDDAEGTTPSEPGFYTYAEDGAFGSVECYLGTRTFEFSNGGSSSTANSIFDFNGVATGNLYLEPFALVEGAGQRHNRLTVYNELGTVMATLDFLHNSDQPAATYLSYSAGGGCAISAAVSAFNTFYTTELVWNYATQEFQVLHNGAPTADADCNTIPFANPSNSMSRIEFGGTGSQSTRFIFDDLTTSDLSDAGPAPPPGLSATVSLGFDGSHSLVELRWPLSPDDPEPTVGEYEYLVYLLGVLVATDSITPSDGDGARFHLIDYSAGGILSFWVQARNATNGLVSDFSCSVSVDADTTGDFDSCGDTTGFPSNLPVAPGDTADGLLGFCSGLMGASDGSLFLCGLIFVVFAFMAMAGGYAAITGSTGLGPAIAGSVAGFGMAIFNVFAGIWGIVWAIVLIVLVAAIITVVVKKFVGAGAESGE